MGKAQKRIKEIIGFLWKASAAVSSLGYILSGGIGRSEPGKYKVYICVRKCGSVFSDFVISIYADTKSYLCGIYSYAGHVSFAVANSFVSSFRGTPIVPGDFFSAGTAKNVFLNYHYNLTGTMLLALWMAVMFLFVNVLFLWKKKTE